MSQDINTHDKANKPSTTSTAIQSWSAEADADKLMDDLFADLDRILEGSSKLPTEPTKPDYVSLKSIVIPPITAPPAVIPAQDLVEQPSETNKESSETQSSETKGTKSSDSHAKKSGWSVDKFLWVMALISVGLTALLLLLTQKQRFAPWLPNFIASPSAETQPPSEADYEFGEYALEALEAIDRKAEARQQAGMAGGGTGNPNLPPGATNSSGAINRAMGANPPGTILERIYYPVYPPQSSWIPPVPPANSSVAPPPAPAPSPAANPPAPTAPPPQVTAQTPPASPPTVAPTSPTASASPTPPAPPPPPPVNHTLVGVLESDELSAALFEIDGITQRINIGEAIGTSGWMLVEVNNGEAIIRRNGEVRSVYTGQTF
ncbi:hypothetical protein [Coleofasciculus sp. E1-EBD-02]|uniref:hypothetical protein n=1 Tax=Coleofasciculus sp. E1-EBD-02 TaxID=3068481 RepID=UPI0032FB682F